MNDVTKHDGYHNNNMIQYTPEQIQIIKNNLTDNHTDTEFQYFIEFAGRRRLDILGKQIYSVIRGKGEKRKQSIMTSIDGLRAIAHRTGQCVGISPTDFEYGRDANGRINRKLVVAATTTVKRVLASGHVGEFSGTAYASEYEGFMYRDKPHIMLAKASEAQALRKGFPEEVGSIYTPEEIPRDEEDPPPPRPVKNTAETTKKQDLIEILGRTIADKVLGKTLEEKGQFLKMVVGVNSWKEVEKYNEEQLANIIGAVKIHEEPKNETV